jgi:outer membrane protein assembly factor BamB
MKKIALALLILPIMLSCMLFANPPLGESNFPLTKVLTIPVDGEVEEIAIADTWIAVHTYEKIIAMDIETQKMLWSINMQVDHYGESFKIINNTLIAASQDQIILVDKQGQKREIALEPIKGPINIIKVASIYPNHVYVIRGEWILEVYDISENTMLWKMFVGRRMGNVFYDSSNNVAYVTTDDSLRAFDNSSGKLLWEMIGVFGQSVLFEAGVLYVPEQAGVDNAFRLAAIDAASQTKLWEKDIAKSPNYSVSNRTIIDNLLVVSGNGMIAISKSNGEQVWTTPGVGEEFYTVPVKFDGVIYAKGIATGAVYAISLDDGTIIGHVRLEDIGFDTANGDVYVLKDGIVFNTRNDIVIYKAK